MKLTALVTWIRKTMARRRLIKYTKTMAPVTLEAWTPEQLRTFATLKEQEIQAQSEGAGDGAFLPDMTEDEYQTYLREETHGWRAFYNQITRQHGQN